MRFVKAHGAGNDFVLIEDLDDTFTPTARFVAALCNRHKGVGADGLIRIVRAETADFFMDYYNADGDVAEMCGNGIRTLAKYVVDRGIHAGDALAVATRAGVKPVTVERDDRGVVARARVDMGAPILERAAIPMTGDGDPLHEKVEALGYTFEAACVSMGNPHCVLFLDALPDSGVVPFERLGPAIETMDLFPAKTNVEFTRVLNDHEVRVRVWERGVGETQACGTGACATAVAANLRGLTGRSVAVHLPGGTLEIEWTSETVFMTGPAEEVFEGTLGPGITRLLESKG
ncbi:MAG TPA: diaminopimelate epimerase [Actinomycetota bacterium]